MKYLIVQEWANTKDNHAGMKHMCDLLCQRYPENYKMFVKPMPIAFPRESNKFKNKINFHKRYIYQKLIYPVQYWLLCKSMFKELKSGDSVFLLEFLTTDYSQLELAKYVRRFFPHVNVYALTHLTPSYYSGYKAPRQMILNWISYVDKVLTLGNSLSFFLRDIGVPAEKISTGLHYVDTDYYSPFKNQAKGERIKIISMGTLQRDYNLLDEIVRKTPYIDWIICCGRKKVDGLFSDSPNVLLKGFLLEDELRELMGKADLSLNVLEDTVGSNVITTSMSMGLGIIVSDVGSIHDYCGEDNAVFCDNNSQSFIDAIHTLSKNKQKIEQMKIASLARVDKLRIESVHQWFSSL